MRSLFSVLLVLMLSSPAFADCEEQVPALLWSYPAKNQTDVPTNAVFTLLTTRDQKITVLLDDVELAARGSTGWDRYVFVPELQPNTDYKIVVQIGDGPTTKKIQVAFQTGADEATAAQTPSLEGTSALVEVQEGTCGLVAAAQSCDIEAGSRVGLTLSEQPVGWVVEDTSGTQTLWPGSCQAEVFTVGQGAADADTCFTVRAVGADGSLSEAVQTCPYEPVSPSTPDGAGVSSGGGASGCATGPVARDPGLVGLWLLLAWLGLCVGRRAMA